MDTIQRSVPSAPPRRGHSVNPAPLDWAYLGIAALSGAVAWLCTARSAEAPRDALGIFFASAIAGVVIANKSGMSVIRAKIVIDCTGDADVAARSGVPFDLGDDPGGNLQPATLFFRIGNVDTAKLDAHIREHASEIRPFYGPFSWLIRERAAEWGDVPRAEVCLFETPTSGEFRMNVTRILRVDGTNAEHLTAAELEGMRQAHKVFRFLRQYAAGFEHAKFLGTAATVGIRETRHIRGRARLAADDVRGCRVPADRIAVMATNMDTHNEQDAGGAFFVLDRGPFFGVPYPCLLPVGISNLLVAGRAISADATAASATRMMPCCPAFGQAAGTAAAMAARQGVDPGFLDTAALRSRLEQQGAYLGRDR
jgi:hypothetical protein